MPSCHAPVMKRSRQLPRLSGWCTDAPLTRLLPASVFLRGEEIGPSRPFAVNTLSRVRRCIRLPGNEAGRDFVVGDLHGHRELLERQLEQMGFNTHFDRLFSVGDLIDRGPHSLATLALIEEPWFHAVLGNHELRLLHHLGYYRSRLHAGIKSGPARSDQRAGHQDDGGDGAGRHGQHPVGDLAPGGDAAATGMVLGGVHGASVTGRHGSGKPCEPRAGGSGAKSRPA